MKRAYWFLVYVLSIADAFEAKAQLAVAKTFVPEGSHICQMERVDVKTGKMLSSKPAVFQASLLPQRPPNIVLAYSSEAAPNCFSAHILVLEKTNSSWKNLASFSYPNKYLWSQNGINVGIRLVSLPSNNYDSLQVITSQGAALGATIEVLHWNDLSRRFENVMASDAEGTVFEASAGKIVVRDERNGASQNSGTYTYSNGRFKKEQVRGKH